MAKVIKFRPQEQDNEAKSRLGRLALKSCGYDTVQKECISPIIIERLNRKVISIAFHIGFFNTPMLMVTLMIQARGANWTYHELEKTSQPQYAAFLIELKEDFENDNGNVLATIASSITKAVYLDELREWTNTVKITDLASPYCYTQWSGAHVSEKTIEILTDYGFNTTRDLLALSREEVCQIPGMTTSEVVKLEKSLASRGLFLETKVDAF